MENAIQETTRAGLTKYPNIYKHVYWGWDRLKGDEIERDAHCYSRPDIIENRNRFIEERGIKRFFKLPSRLYYDKSASPIFTGCNQMGIFDHREFYLTDRNTIIILCSPYGGANRDIICDCYGFKETYPMYGNGAISYYIEIPNNLTKKYLQTQELQKYWGGVAPIYSPKKGFLYWRRVMYYEQNFMRTKILPGNRTEHDVLERENDIIAQYMSDTLNPAFYESYKINTNNLYEFHKSLSVHGIASVNTDCWVSAVTKSMI